MGVDASRCNLQARRVENALAIALQAGANLDDLRAADPDVTRPVALVGHERPAADQDVVS